MFIMEKVNRKSFLDKSLPNIEYKNKIRNDEMVVPSIKEIGKCKSSLISKHPIILDEHNQEGGNQQKSLLKRDSFYDNFYKTLLDEGKKKKTNPPELNLVAERRGSRMSINAHSSINLGHLRNKEISCSRISKIPMASRKNISMKNILSVIKNNSPNKRRQSELLPCLSAEKQIENLKKVEEVKKEKEIAESVKNVVKIPQKKKSSFFCFC